MIGLPGVAWWVRVLDPCVRCRWCGVDRLGGIHGVVVWLRFSLILLVFLRLVAVELAPLRSVVGLPPLRVPFVRV